MRPIEILTYTNANGDSIEFSVKSKYHCNVSQDVEGLTGIENEIYSTSGVNQAGETYLGYHIEAKDIEIVGHFNSLDKTEIRQLRHALSHALNPTYPAELTYQCGDFKRKISCRIENAPEIEADEVFTQFTIQLSCLNPYWQDTSETRTYIATWIGAMEFDSVNGLQLTNSKEDPQWIIGYREPNLIAVINNEGDAKTGLTIEFTALGTLSNPGIINVITQEYLQINKSMKPGEKVIVKTGYGEKSVKFIDEHGVESDAFRSLDINSTYLQLDIGENPFRYYASTGEELLDCTIIHTGQYLGV